VKLEHGGRLGVRVMAAAGVETARVFGEGPRGCGRLLNRPGGGHIGVRARD
jgi:hypothetical protein